MGVRSGNIPTPEGVDRARPPVGLLPYSSGGGTILRLGYPLYPSTRRETPRRTVTDLYSNHPGAIGPWSGRRFELAILAIGLFALVCSGAWSGAAGTPIHSMDRSPMTAGRFASPFPTPIRHVVIIMLENEEAKVVLANGTYERSLAHTYAYASQFYSPLHYSLPSYLAATSGYTTNYLGRIYQANVGGLAQSANLTWKEYEESMPVPWYLGKGITSGGYDPYHNPFALYEPFINNSAACAQHMVNFTKLNTDLAADRMPNYAFIVPNVTHDGHNSSLTVSDTWLSGWLPQLLNSSFFRSAALFLTYDEGTTNLGVNGSSGGGHVYFAMISPYARAGFSSTVNYTEFNVLTTTEWLLGLGSTHTHDNWSTYPPMRDLFDFPVRVSGTVETRAGTPLAGVRVLDGTGNSSRTNASGGFTFELRDGNYTLSVARGSGYHGRLRLGVVGTPIGGLVLRVT